MRKRVQLAYSAERGYHVPLPHYTMVPKSHAPITKGMIHEDGILPHVDPADAIARKVSVLVDIPHDIALTPDGEIDAAKMRKRYPQASMFGDKGYIPPKILGDR